MRLINVNTLNLDNLIGRNEKYAILSHRWGNQEVKFEDYPSVKSQIVDQVSKPQVDNRTTGISKIANSCLQCRKLKLSYLWIDTCCIDKRNGSEENESINSMFNWYQEAEICLAFLADVGGGQPKAVSDSEWFTRGWTLQELLAPKNITFFDRDWVNIGTKSSRSPDIEKATRIAPKHMIDFKTASVATRMSWQSGRETTRPEDLAYSMFGIFDVGMDLRYGERDKAFRRLQEEIINRYPRDESILAWTSNEFGDDEQVGILAPRPSCFRETKNLTVTSASHKYEPRNSYQISNKGLEISVPLASSKTQLFFAGSAEQLRRKLKKVDLTLNCWEEGKQGPSIVVIHLRKDNRGYFYRTNCESLSWAKAVDSRTFMGGNDVTTAVPVQL
ncbi:hypothetical protein MMC28_008091 [Mycoblastus sanguinarius]|nr:hypothetical protein [Mycoblastus sanguinarius]